ncbi:MAG: flagellar motor switch protein FliN [Gammaproteobacteria bacterium]|nr:flagellar motor switch protein FliN [Gammaproteobacteria bacterium]
MTDTPTMDVAKEEEQQSAAGQSLQPAPLSKLSGSNDLPSGSDVGLEMILDVAVNVSLELGRTTLTVRDLLQLNQGSIVEFERRVGEPLDLLVNGTLLAHGELVVVDDRFGIRLTDVVSPAQRLEKLK